MLVVINQVFLLSHIHNKRFYKHLDGVRRITDQKNLLLLAFTQAGQPVLEVSLVHQKPLNFGTLYEARVISQHLYVQSKADKAGRRVLQTNPTLK